MHLYYSYLEFPQRYLLRYPQKVVPLLIQTVSQWCLLCQMMAKSIQTMSFHHQLNGMQQLQWQSWPINLQPFMLCIYTRGKIRANLRDREPLVWRQLLQGMEQEVDNLNLLLSLLCYHTLVKMSCDGLHLYVTPQLELEIEAHFLISPPKMHFRRFGKHFSKLKAFLRGYYIYIQLPILNCA